MLSPTIQPGLQLLSGIILGGVVGFLAWHLGALSASGAWAAALTGSVVFGLGGIPWALLLLAFFVSSSLLSRLAGQRKAGLSEKYAKGAQRDWGQVLANGGLGAGLVLLHAILPGGDWLWLAYAGAFAAVNADTWATELGVFSPQPPRLITSRKVVEQGSSGGVTFTGYLAAGGGALLIAGLAASYLEPGQVWSALGIVTLSGLAGATLDSLLGGTVQAIYTCPACDRETEQFPRHTCGTQTRQIRGWGWLNNDWVNALSSMAGALLALVLWLLVT